MIVWELIWFYILPGQVFNRSGGFSSVRSSMSYDEKDYQNLKKSKIAIAVVPIFQKSTIVEALGKEEEGILYGTNSEIFELRSLKPALGYIFKETDINKKKQTSRFGSRDCSRNFWRGGISFRSKKFG